MLIVRARDRQAGKGRVDRENDFVLRFKMCQRNDQGREEFLSWREEKTMITVYGMPSCPDCASVEEQIRGRKDFRMVDIGAHVVNLKAFLRLRDLRPEFDEARRMGYVGIPCFVLEDGGVTLDPRDVGLE